MYISVGEVASTLIQRFFLHEKVIQVVSEEKSLGVLLDAKLIFRSHISHLKKNCNIIPDLSKVISSRPWGA